MKSRLILISFLILFVISFCAAQSTRVSTGGIVIQPGTGDGLLETGYLGRRNHIAISVSDALWNDSFSVEYSLGLNDWSMLAFSGGLIASSRTLTGSENQFLGIGSSNDIGEASSSGIVIGTSYSLFNNQGLGAPLGYYFGVGVSYYNYSNREQVTDAAMSSPWFQQEIEWKGSGLRIHSEWGIRFMVAEPVTLTFGAQAGVISAHRVTLKDSVEPNAELKPIAFLPYRGSSIGIKQNYKKGEERILKIKGFTFTPVFKLGLAL